MVTWKPILGGDYKLCRTRHLGKWSCESVVRWLAGMNSNRIGLGPVCLFRCLGDERKLLWRPNVQKWWLWRSREPKDYSMNDFTCICYPPPYGQMAVPRAGVAICYKQMTTPPVQVPTYHKQVPTLQAGAATYHKQMAAPPRGATAYLEQMAMPQARRQLVTNTRTMGTAREGSCLCRPSCMLE